MSAYEPGTVAVATVRGVPNVRVIRRAMSWITGEAVGGGAVQHDEYVTDIRPLVVLDLSPNPVEGDAPGRSESQLLISMLRETAENFFTPDAAELARKVADQIEQQTRPPKPAEPKGLGAVVEDAKGARWLRVDWVNPWCLAQPQKRDQGRALHGTHVTWDRIDAVKVLSEGVQS